MCFQKARTYLPSSLFQCVLHTEICFANIHKYRFNWKLSTPYSFGGNCWVTGVDWNIRAWLLNLSYFWTYSPLELGNPSYLISPHSLHLPLLCWVLSLRMFDEDREVSYYTAAMACCVLAQLLSDFLVSPWQGTSALELLEELCWKLTLSYLELKITLSLPGLGQHPATLLHYGWGLEADKRRKEFIKAGHFAFLQKGTLAKGQWEKRKHRLQGLLLGFPTGNVVQEDCDWKEGTYSLFPEITMMMMMKSVNIIKLLLCARHSASYFTHFILLFHLIFTTTVWNTSPPMPFLQTDSAGDLRWKKKEIQLKFIERNDTTGPIL